MYNVKSNDLLVQDVGVLLKSSRFNNALMVCVNGIRKGFDELEPKASESGVIALENVQIEEFSEWQETVQVDEQNNHLAGYRVVVGIYGEDEIDEFIPALRSSIETHLQSAMEAIPLDCDCDPTLGGTLDRTRIVSRRLGINVIEAFVTTSAIGPASNC